MRENSKTLKVTPAGRRFMGFLASFNSGEVDDLREFIRAHYTEDALEEYSLDSLLDWHQEIYEQTGGMKIHKIFFSEEYYIMAVVEARRDGALYLDKMKVDDASPHKVVEYLHDELPDQMR